jgi:hypothetical protein
MSGYDEGSPAAKDNLHSAMSRVLDAQQRVMEYNNGEKPQASKSLEFQAVKN